MAIFGKAFQDRLSSVSYMLIGVGGIGNEILKNWATMGVACSQSGAIHVLDNDRVEASDLHRSVLFRRSDISVSSNKFPMLKALYTATESGSSIQGRAPT